jgi:hypothetical protein
MLSHVTNIAMVVRDAGPHPLLSRSIGISHLGKFGSQTDQSAWLRSQNIENKAEKKSRVSSFEFQMQQARMIVSAF